MKNKKTLWICAAVLVLAAVLLIGFLCRSGGEKPAAEAEPEAQAESAQSGETVRDAETQPVEGAEEESGDSAQLIESGGDLIITIPDDEESDGF